MQSKFYLLKLPEDTTKQNIVIRRLKRLGAKEIEKCSKNENTFTVEMDEALATLIYELTNIQLIEEDEKYFPNT